MYKLNKKGFWKKSRHPNLFFELLTWISFSLFAFDLEKLNFECFIGPLILFAIMKFLTIRITEKVMKKSRPYWDEYVKQTNELSII